MNYFSFKNKLFYGLCGLLLACGIPSTSFASTDCIDRLLDTVPGLDEHPNIWMREGNTERGYDLFLEYEGTCEADVSLQGTTNSDKFAVTHSYPLGHKVDDGSGNWVLYDPSIHEGMTLRHRLRFIVDLAAAPGLSEGRHEATFEFLDNTNSSAAPVFITEGVSIDNTPPPKIEDWEIGLNCYEKLFNFEGIRVEFPYDRYDAHPFNHLTDSRWGKIFAISPTGAYRGSGFYAGPNRTRWYDEVGVQIWATYYDLPVVFVRFDQAGNMSEPTDLTYSFSPETTNSRRQKGFGEACVVKGGGNDKDSTDNGGNGNGKGNGKNK